MKKSRKSNITLPESILEKIYELNLSNTNKSHALKFIQLLIRDSIRTDGTIFSFISKPKKYLDKTFSTKYYKAWLKDLLDNEIVERTDKYGEGVSYYFRLNPSLFDSLVESPIICVEKIYKTLINRELKDIQKDINKESNQLNNWFIEDIKSLTVDYDVLQNISFNTIERMNINDYQIDDAVPNGVYRYSHNGLLSKNYLTLAAIKQIATSENKSVILRKKICVIERPEQFIKNRKVSTLIYHANLIENLKMGYYRAERNSTNNRLDTNITNMYSPMVDLICSDNQLVQIDITNSQFAFLSMALRDQLNSDDFKAFQRISILGKLYESIEGILSLDSRKMSKNTMFEILFSSRNNNTKTKKELKQHFPNLIKWIDDFKKNNGDKKFSVMLQKQESEVMIDGVYMALKAKKLFCLTKHDSVIVRKENYEEALEIIKDIFTNTGLECQLKTTWCYDDSVKTQYHPVHHILTEKNERLKINIPYLHSIYMS
jgi:hypothetical protein